MFLADFYQGSLIVKSEDQVACDHYDFIQGLGLADDRSLVFGSKVKI